MPLSNEWIIANSTGVEKRQEPNTKEIYREYGNEFFLVERLVKKGKLLFLIQNDVIKCTVPAREKATAKVSLSYVLPTIKNPCK